MSLITIIEADIKAGWEWIRTEAAIVYNGVAHLIEPLWKAFGQVVLQDFWGAAAAFVQKLTTLTNLADMEQAFLMAVEHLGGDLWNALRTLATTAWSNLLQSLLGVLNAHNTAIKAA